MYRITDSYKRLSYLFGLVALLGMNMLLVLWLQFSLQERMSSNSMK